MIHPQSARRARSRRSPPLRTVLAIACAAALLGACGGAGHNEGQLYERIRPTLETHAVAAPETGVLMGLVSLDEPVVGAHVVLRSPGGEILAQARSDRNGGFVLKAPAQLPRDVLLTVTGAQASPAFQGTLMMVWDDFEASNPTARISLPTTLAAHVLDAGLRLHGSFTPTQASAEVRRYLGLPGGWDLGERDVRLFDASAFLRDHEAAPMDEALAQLARQIVADPGLTRPYRGVLLGSTIEDDALNASVNLAVYGLEYLSQFDHPVTEKISGWGMSAMNWLRPDYSARFDQIDSKLKEMTASLGVIERRVAVLNATMKEGFERVEAGLAALQRQGELQALQAAYGRMSNAVVAVSATIKGLQSRYTMLLTVEPGPETPIELWTLANDIEKEIPTAIQHLSDLQAGTALDPAMTSMAFTWHRLQAAVTPHYPVAVGSQFFEAINQQQDQIAGLQVLALNLLMEARNYKANVMRPADALDDLARHVSPYARHAFEVYSEQIRATQAVVAYPRIDPGLVANLHTGRLYVRHAAALWMENNCAQLHVAWTEAGNALARELRAPGVDCDFSFANGVRAFNAMRPFGYAYWSVGAMPTFVPDPARINLTVAQEAGYDFSAIYRHGFEARASQVVGVQDGRAASYWAFQDRGKFTVIPSPLTSVQPLQSAQDNGQFFNVFFSRPIRRDEPLVNSCNVKADGSVHCSFS